MTRPQQLRALPEITDLRSAREDLQPVVDWFRKALQKQWVRDIPDFDLYISICEETAALVEGAPLTEYGFAAARLAQTCYLSGMIGNVSATKPPREPLTLEEKACRREKNRVLREIHADLASTRA